MHIPLSAPNYGQDEINEVIDSLESRKVTMGEKVARFEEQFAAYIGVKHAVMVNSGSSATLVALTALDLKRGSEVITPAVNWSTTVFSIMQTQNIPVLVDVTLPELTISIEHTCKSISRETKCLLPVHLLGYPCDMVNLSELKQDLNLFMVEDCCEALGAETYGRKVGSFGDLAVFSFFFSHHISTIEGGMIVTDNEEYANAARSLRVHGWIRGRTDEAQLHEKYPELDKRFTFITAGYSVRPTELQACFGLHQLLRLEGFLRDRERNADYWNKHLPENHLILPHPPQNIRHAWFLYPIGVRKTAPFTRNQLVQHLEENGIETRPVMTGNMIRQPVMKGRKYKAPLPLVNSDFVTEDWFLIGNHSGIREAEHEYVTKVISEFAS